MKYSKSLFLAGLILLFANAAVAQTQLVSISQPLQAWPLGDAALDSHINKITAEIDDATGSEYILKSLLRDSDNGDVLIDPKIFKDKDFYCIIHVLRWSPPAGANNSQTIQAQNWYLYNLHNLTQGNSKTVPRLFGAKRITLLYIHLNKQGPDYDPLYRVEIVKKTPAYLSHLLGLAGLYNSLTGAAAAAPGTVDYWAAYTFTVQHKVSDISITPKVTRKATGTVEDAGLAQNFDNEGKYFVDFSVGVPIRRFSQLSFDSTANTVGAKEVDKTSVLALLNLYPRPIDIKSTGVNMVPHFVGGVAIDKQPLHKIFVGTGFGPIVSNFYIGALFVKQQQLSTLKPGDPATPAQLNSNIRYRYKTQVAFGINVPVGAVIEKLKGK